MFNNFFEKYPDYTIIEKVSTDVLSKYTGVLPDLLIQFWKEYGFGIYMNGFLKFINPDDYQKDLNEGFYNEENEIVFAITAFGDFITWVERNIAIVRFRNGTYNYINGKDIEFFFEKHLIDDTYSKIEFLDTNYLPAKERLGDLAFNECFGYVPILGMGGSEKPENLEKVKIKEHISIIAQMMGKLDIV